MKQWYRIILPLCLMAILLAGCGQKEVPADPSDTYVPGGDWPPATTDVTVEGYKESFEAASVGGGYEVVYRDDERSVYNVPEGAPWYEYYYRAYPLENGITRLLAYRYGYLAGDNDQSLDVACEVADFYDGKLITTQEVDAASLTDFTVKGVTYHEPATSYGWLDQNHIYLAGRSRLAIVNLLSGEISVPTADPEAIYEAASSHGAAYLAVVVEPYAMDGKLYYLSYRDPDTLNTYGDIYEADIGGERLIVQGAMGVAVVGDGAVAYLALPEGGLDEEAPNAERLFCYDVENARDAEVFGETGYELDREHNIVGGTALGNWWADKQEHYNNPAYIMDERQLFFYVSRIADEKVDRYVYDIATGKLLLQRTTPASDYQAT